MSERKPTRRDLLRPVQLLGLAFAAAVFGGIVTLLAMGFFQGRGGEQGPRSVTTALVVAGITFIVTLVGIALLMLAVDPAQISKPLDRPVLLRDDPDEDTDAAAPGGTTPRPGG